MQLFGQYQRKFVLHHLICLVFTNPRLKGKQVLFLNSPCLGQNLTPAILAGRLYPQHGQANGRKVSIVIMDNAWENKVRLCPVLGHLPA